MPVVTLHCILFTWLLLFVLIVDAGRFTHTILTAEINITFAYQFNIFCVAKVVGYHRIRFHLSQRHILYWFVCRICILYLYYINWLRWQATVPATESTLIVLFCLIFVFLYFSVNNFILIVFFYETNIFPPFISSINIMLSRAIKVHGGHILDFKASKLRNSKNVVNESCDMTLKFLTIWTPLHSRIIDGKLVMSLNSTYEVFYWTGGVHR